LGGSFFDLKKDAEVPGGVMSMLLLAVELKSRVEWLSSADRLLPSSANKFVCRVSVLYRKR